MKETYLTVAGRIRRELSALDEVTERIAEVWEQGEGERHRVDAVALNLHGFYAGLERIAQ